MHFPSDYGYVTPIACSACGSVEMPCCDGKGWPVRANGSRKTIGEMTHAEQLRVARMAVDRLKPEFAAMNIALQFGGSH